MVGRGADDPVWNVVEDLLHNPEIHNFEEEEEKLAREEEARQLHLAVQEQQQRVDGHEKEKGQLFDRLSSALQKHESFVAEQERQRAMEEQLRQDEHERRLDREAKERERELKEQQMMRDIHYQELLHEREALREREETAAREREIERERERELLLQHLEAEKEELRREIEAKHEDKQKAILMHMRAEQERLAQLQAETERDRERQMQDQADKAKERMRKTQILRAESVALLEEAKAREQQRRQQREMEREAETRRQQLRHQWRVQNPAAPEPAQVTPPAEKDRFRGDPSPRWVARGDASEESGEPEQGKSHGKETDAVSGASVMEAPLLQRGAGEPPETSEWDHDVAHDSCTQAHQLVEEPSLPFACNHKKLLEQLATRQGPPPTAKVPPPPVPQVAPVAPQPNDVNQRLKPAKPAPGVLAPQSCPSASPSVKPFVTEIFAALEVGSVITESHRRLVDDLQVRLARAEAKELALLHQLDAARATITTLEMRCEQFKTDKDKALGLLCAERLGLEKPPPLLPSEGVMPVLEAQSKSVTPASISGSEDSVSREKRLAEPPHLSVQAVATPHQALPQQAFEPPPAAAGHMRLFQPQRVISQGPQLYALDKGRSELASLMRLPDDARQPLTTKDKAKDQGQDPQTTVKGNEHDDACIQLSESEYYHPTDKDKDWMRAQDELFQALIAGTDSSSAGDKSPAQRLTSPAVEHADGLMTVNELREAAR